MKNIFIATMLKMIIGFPLAATLAACSSGPSNGDIKEEILKNVLRDCSLLSIGKFEKINGIPDARSDKVYQVQVAYSIDLDPAKENKNLVKKMSDYLSEIADMIDRRGVYLDKYHALNDKLEAESNGDHMGVLKKLEQDPEISTMKKEHEAFEKIYPQYYLYKGDEAQMLLWRMRANVRKTCPDTNFSGLMPEKIEDFGEGISKTFEANFTMRDTDNGWKIAR